MGKFAESVTPVKEGATLMPDPPQHDKIDKPKAGATQGMRTTQSGAQGPQVSKK